MKCEMKYSKSVGCSNHKVEVAMIRMVGTKCRSSKNSKNSKNSA